MKPGFVVNPRPPSLTGFFMSVSQYQPPPVLCSLIFKFSLYTSTVRRKASLVCKIDHLKFVVGYVYLTLFPMRACVKLVISRSSVARGIHHHLNHLVRNLSSLHPHLVDILRYLELSNLRYGAQPVALGPHTPPQLVGLIIVIHVLKGHVVTWVKGSGSLHQRSIVAGGIKGNIGRGSTPKTSFECFSFDFVRPCHNKNLTSFRTWVHVDFRPTFTQVEGTNLKPLTLYIYTPYNKLLPITPNWPHHTIRSTNIPGNDASTVVPRKSQSCKSQ